MRAAALVSPLIVLFSAGTLDAQRITVGPNEQVSRTHPLDAHYEVCSAIDPRNRSHLIAASFRYAHDGSSDGTVVYSSRDGGRTWSVTLDSPLLDNTSDPSCAYGPDGSAYFVASYIPPASGSDRSLRQMKAFRSLDGGKTWAEPSLLTYTDRESVVIDTTGGQYSGRVYVVGNHRLPVGLSTDVVAFYSSDSGRTFAGPGKRPGFASGYDIGSSANAVVAPDGTLVTVFTQVDPGAKGGSTPLYAAVSKDGGQSFSAGARIADHIAAGNRKGTTHNNANEIPSAAIDSSQGRYRNRLYVAWPEGRSGHGQIEFAYSDDLGTSWSKPRIISDNPPSDVTTQFMPTVAVNRDGMVGVMWYDRRNHPDNLGWDVRFIVSVDGGQTFTPSVQVSEQGTNFGDTTDLGPLPQQVRATAGKTGAAQHVQLSLRNFLFIGGDYAALVADSDGVFHAVWCDNHTGTSQLWTAPITVTAGRRYVPQTISVRNSASQAPVAGPRSSASLSDGDGGQPERREFRKAGARDVSGQVILELDNSHFDRGSGVLSSNLRLLNTGKEAVQGPFIVRVADIESQLGNLAIETADNAIHGAGAEWRIADEQIAAGAMSTAKAVRFRLTGARPFADGNGGYRLNLLTMNVAIYGETQP